MRTTLNALLLSALTLACAPPAAKTRAARERSKTTTESLAVVVNRNNPVEELSFDELRLYFLGERTRWPGGRRVALVMPAPPRPEHDAVLRLIYDMRERDFREHFLRARFTGESLEEPRLFDTAARLLNFVLLQHGAVGCVRAAEVGPSVKVLRVDGLAPGDAGYKLTF